MTTPAFPALSKSFSAFGYEIEEDYGTIWSPKASGLHASMSTLTIPTRKFIWARDYLPLRDGELVQGFFRDRKGGAEAYTIDVYDDIWSPYDSPTLSQTAGGGPSRPHLLRALHLG